MNLALCIAKTEEISNQIEQVEKGFNKIYIMDFGIVVGSISRGEDGFIIYLDMMI